MQSQIDTLKYGLDLAQEQINDLEKLMTGVKFEELSLDAKKEFINNEIAYLYLGNFWGQYEFLWKKLQTEKPEDMHFYLPFLRSLIEGYGELLFLLSQDEKQKVGVFIGNYLLNLSNAYRFVAKSESIKNEYNRFLNLGQEILSSHSIALPTDIDKLSNHMLDDMSLTFPKYEFIFQQNYFKELSTETFNCWSKDSSEKFYNIYYRTYSSYTHKSFTNQTKGATKNEIFWIIQFLYLIGQLMFELCDQKVFVNKYNANFQEFYKKIAEVHPKLLEAWNGKPVSPETP